MRWEPPVTLILRRAARDAVLAGVPVEKGANMALLIGAANRDERKYTDPDRYDMFREQRQHVGFGFGLIHGFGFASALMDLGLPNGALALSLAGFNLGVETGQVAIVAAFLPLAYLARRTGFYRAVVLKGGSWFIAALASLWFLERSLNVRFLPIH